MTNKKLSQGEGSLDSGFVLRAGLLVPGCSGLDVNAVRVLNDRAAGALVSTVWGVLDSFVPMYSLAEENYLKGMFHLADAAGEVSVADLSRHLGIKMPTVNSMVKKLSEKSLVHYESYKPLRLTESGRIAAALIIRKHRLTEMFLVEKMGFGWEAVHEIAEQIEHIQAPEFFEKMDELLGYPQVDPHGSPIPDPNGKIAVFQHIRLADCKPGDVVKLSMVTHSSQDFLRFLNSRELSLGTTLEIKSVEAYDGSMDVQYGKRRKETLSRQVCEALLVSKL